MFDTDSPTDICGVGVQGGTLMGMTREEQNRKLKAFITCLKCEVSGKPCDDNCPTQYEAGNMGEIIENLETISKALEQEPTTKNNLGVDCISRQAVEDITWQDPGYSDALNVLTEVRDKVRALPSVTPQEPFDDRLCISSGVCEYDKQKVLDKIRAEIETKYGQCDICEYFEDYDYEENDISEYRSIGDIADILQIIDKYKAEVEPQESEDKE